MYGHVYMARQIPSEGVTLEIESFVRGYHAHMAVWEPQVGEMLALERESHNPVDWLYHVCAHLKLIDVLRTSQTKDDTDIKLILINICEIS